MSDLSTLDARAASYSPTHAAGYSVRWLRAALLGGALVDFSGAVGFFLFPAWVEGMLQLPIQTDFWPKYAGVFLLVLTALYCVMAIDPKRSLATVAVALFGRAAGAAFYAGWCFSQSGIQAKLFAFSMMNVGFAVAYWFILRRAGRADLWAALRGVPMRG